MLDYGTLKLILGAQVAIVDTSAFTFATDRCVEQLDRTLHLIYSRTRMDLDVLHFSGSWYWAKYESIKG
jgi:hypothetical protein